MIKVNILSVHSRIPNFSTYPIRYNKQRLKTLGFDVRIIFRSVPENMTCDILCLNSKYFTKWWERPEEVFEYIQTARQYCNKIVWMDDSDSTGVTHFELLPVIDFYLKKQLLRDKTLYARPLYGDRIFTDFYHREFDVADDSIYQSKLLDLKYLHKVQLSWHIGLGNMVGDIMTYPKVMGPFKALFPASYKMRLFSPKRERDIDVMGRGRRDYERNTVMFHRKQIGALLDKLGHLNIAVNGHVPVRQYKREIAGAKLVVSPFGWGEIGVRDFEAFIYGAALVKPDMSHLETWPDIFIPGITYQPISWNFEKLEDVLDHLLEHPEERLKLALAGQNAYRNMISREGMEAFCQWFIQQISDMPIPNNRHPSIDKRRTNKAEKAAVV